MEQIKFSFYDSKKSTQKIDIDCSDYCDMITNGKFQDIVLQGRLMKKDIESYRKFKKEYDIPIITGSAIMNQGSKEKSNIHELNGLIVIDIDIEVNLELINKINADQYTFISHRSFGGDGICVFIKINPNKFLESFNEIGQYYWDNFNIIIDKSCSNTNRLRFISYDPYLYKNDKSKKFVAKGKIKKEKPKQDFVFSKNDFSEIINQVKDIDLCQDDYKRYCDIGFAIGSKFGISGLEYFKAVCQSGSKYDERSIEKHYKNFCKQGNITISTFYHYVKEAGFEVYSESTKATIKAVNVQKAQGKATLESVSNVLKIQKIEIDEPLINDLIESKIDYKVDENLSDMAQLENFIVENYAPVRNLITNEIKIDGIIIDDHKLNTIYKTASKVLDFNVAKSDVRDIINSDSTKDFNPLNSFFSNREFIPGQIDAYIDCIHPYSDYNRWAFKKWIVGCVHNWLSPLQERKVSPLTLVLCGQKQGTGKTSFFRNLLPEELSEYLIEKKIDPNEKDSMYNLAKGLLCFDDEFGGLATKDVKDFKRVADTNWIDTRLPYSSLFIKIKRRASICGTTNESNILKDVTGNRRLLPCNVEWIDYDKMIQIDTDSLWREAFKLWRDGFDWKIFKESDINFLNANTTSNIDVNAIEEIFFNHFAINPSAEFSERVVMNQGEILNYLASKSSVNVSKFDIKDIFVKNKLKYTAHRVGLSTKSGIQLYKKFSFVEE
jgi:hypothetical protein